MNNPDISKFQPYPKVILLTILGFSFFTIACYPGFMSIDSLDQYSQAHTLRFADQHPPVMAWLWSKLIWISDGPQSLLFLHLGMLWTGLYIWYRNANEHRAAVWFILLGAAPWVANFEGVLWKDMGMAFSLLLGLSLLIAKKPAKLQVFVAIVLLLYAFMVRTNSPTAIVPIIWYTSGKLFPLLSNRIKLAITLLSMALMFAFTNFFNYYLLGAEKNHIATFMMVDDLVHLSMIEDKSLLPKVDLKTVKECSQETIGETKLVGRMFCFTNKASYLNVSPISYEDIKKSWITEVKNNPIECVKFRLNAYQYFLRNPKVGPYIYMYSGISPNEMGLVQNFNVATIILNKYVISMAYLAPFLFKPYWWLITAIIFLCATLLMQGDKESLSLIRVLLVSALLYMLGYMPLAPMADFRYVYWSTLAISLAAIKFIASNLYFRYKLQNDKT